MEREGEDGEEREEGRIDRRRMERGKMEKGRGGMRVEGWSERVIGRDREGGRDEERERVQYHTILYTEYPCHTHTQHPLSHDTEHLAHTHSHNSLMY